MTSNPSTVNTIDSLKAFEMAGGVGAYELATKFQAPTCNDSELNFSESIRVEISFYFATTTSDAPLVMRIDISNGWTAAGVIAGVQPQQIPDTPIEGTLKYDNWALLTSYPIGFFFATNPSVVGGAKVVFARGDALIFGEIDIGLFPADMGLIGGKGVARWISPSNDPSQSISLLETIERAGGVQGFRDALAIADQDLPTPNYDDAPVKVKVNFRTTYFLGFLSTTIILEMENGYIGTGYVRNARPSAFFIGPIPGELQTRNFDELVKGPCNWRIQNSSFLGGVIMPISREDVPLATISFGSTQVDIGAVGSFGSLRWIKI